MVPRLIVIGTSLGGIEALKPILGRLSPQIDAAIAIVFHRGADSQRSLLEIISNISALPVEEPEDRTEIVAGRVYLAPAAYHLLVGPCGFSLSVSEPVRLARPSIDMLFESAADSWGSRVIGVLLTAASHDGADGIVSIARAGGITIVQNPETAQSPIAIRAALEATTVNHILQLDQIATMLSRLVSGAERDSLTPMV